MIQVNIAKFQSLVTELAKLRAKFSVSPIGNNKMNGASFLHFLDPVSDCQLRKIYDACLLVLYLQRFFFIMTLK